MTNNVTIIPAADGSPAFAVIPWNEYMVMTTGKRIPKGDRIPHEVVELMTSNGYSLIRAWREYLELSQAEVASRMGIQQPSYVEMEAPDAKPRKSTKERIAKAFGVSYEQISL